MRNTWRFSLQAKNLRVPSRFDDFTRSRLLKLPHKPEKPSRNERQIGKENNRCQSDAHCVRSFTQHDAANERQEQRKGGLIAVLA